MPFVVDDIFLRGDPTGIFRVLFFSYPPFDMIWLFEQIRDYAYREMYDLEKIMDQIKENRMLYEAGEISKEEYEKRDADLKHNLKIAKRVRRTNLENRVNILG